MVRDDTRYRTTYKGWHDYPHNGWGTWTWTTRARVLAVVVCLVVAFVLGLTADVWDPFTRGVWVVSP